MTANVENFELDVPCLCRATEGKGWHRRRIGCRDDGGGVALSRVSDSGQVSKC